MSAASDVIAHLAAVRSAAQGGVGDHLAKRLLERSIDQWTLTADDDKDLLQWYADAGLDPIKAFRQPVVPRSSIQASPEAHRQVLDRLVADGWLVPLTVGRTVMYSAQIPDGA